MTSPAPKIDDLVKDAIKDHISKRKLVPKEEDTASFEEIFELVHKESTFAPTKVIIDPVEKVPGSVEKKPVMLGILKTDEKLFSEVINNKKIENDFGVTCFDRFAWDHHIIGFIPKVDPAYYIDPKAAAAILLAWQLDEKILCYGPTGAGKSSLVEQLCARTNRPFIRINCTGDMDSSMIFGQLVAKDGSTYWVDGPVTEAVKYGAVFAWDEWDVTPPEISMGLQWLLEDKGNLFLKDMPGESSEKMIVPHINFRLVALGNTQGQGDDTGSHAGTNVQNSATLDRFSTCVHIDYLSPEIEEQIIRDKVPKAFTKKATQDLIKFAGLIRKAYTSNQINLTISPRTLLSIARKIEYGLTLKSSIELVYFNKLNNTQRKVAEKLATNVYGSSFENTNS